MRTWLIIMSLFLGTLTANAQQRPARPSYPPVPWTPQREKLISIGFGVAAPLSHESLTQFWTKGPNVSASVMTVTDHRFLVGLGLDASWLFFRKGSFQETYPGVPLQVRDVWLIDFYLTSKYFFRPRAQFSPYVGADVGLHKTTSAEYKVVIDGVRTTYYDIPGSTRLAFGFTGGADYVINRNLGFFLEVRGCYVHHDPDVGWAIFGRGGIELFL